MLLREDPVGDAALDSRALLQVAKNSRRYGLIDAQRGARRLCKVVVQSQIPDRRVARPAREDTEIRGPTALGCGVGVRENPPDRSVRLQPRRKPYLDYKTQS